MLPAVQDPNLPHQHGAPDLGSEGLFLPPTQRLCMSQELLGMLTRFWLSGPKKLVRTSWVSGPPSGPACCLPAYL